VETASRQDRERVVGGEPGVVGMREGNRWEWILEWVR